jgi:hypothetical protein
VQVSRRCTYVVLLLSLSCILVPLFLVVRIYVRRSMVLNAIVAVPLPSDAQPLPTAMTPPEYKAWTPCRGPYHVTATAYYRTQRSFEDVVAFYRNLAPQSGWQLHMDAANAVSGPTPRNPQVTVQIVIWPASRHASPRSPLEAAIHAAAQEQATIVSVTSNHNYQPLWRPACLPPAD